MIKKFMTGIEAPLHWKLSECLNLFGEEGGFEAVVELTRANSINFGFVPFLVHSFDAVGDLLRPKFRAELSNQIEESVFTNLELRLGQNPSAILGLTLNAFGEKGLLEARLLS